MNHNHHDTIIALKKARGLMDKILKMAKNDAYCINIMQQNLAVIGLLKSTNQKLMENHLNTCFKDAMASNNEDKKQEMISEILKVTRLSKR
jgi:DNA-binding FrmR family transcriptional regulator